MYEKTMKMVLTILHFIQLAVKATGSLHKGEQNQCVYLTHNFSSSKLYHFVFSIMSMDVITDSYFSPVQAVLCFT
jgi:prenyltransferase beta subunit